MKFRIAIGVMAIVATVLLARPAEAVTGNDLHAWCDKAGSGTTLEEVAYRARCTSYVMGVVDGMFIADAMSVAKAGNSLKLYCPSEAVTYEQYIDLTINYLNQHPELRHLNASLAVFNALLGGFPCP